MRPTRLRLSGFTAFREPTDLDFTGADLFAFTGPTGSGKSSLVDAMVFALYGCVPRLDQRAVAPVISLGRNEARVQLDFTIGGDAYTAVRVVRRTKSGATTKEARLEGAGGAVLAGNEKELTSAVERLLGLRYDHFTTCVVLPQGEFARFLQAADKERQKLLVSLLDLGLYQRVARRAYEREQAARQRSAVAGTLLDKLAFATPDALAAIEARLDRLGALRSEMGSVAPKLDELRKAEETAVSEASGARREADLLARVVAPATVGSEASARVAARHALAEAEAEAERAAVAVDEADKALVSLMPRSVLEQAARAHTEHATHLTAQQQGLVTLVERTAEADEAAAALGAAESGAAEASARRERASWEHRAHDLAASLVAGEPCPVCRQVVTMVPEPDGLAALDEARTAQQRADTTLVETRRRHEQAELRRAEVAVKLEAITEQLDQLADLVAEHPDPQQVDAALGGVHRAELAERAARQAAAHANRAAVSARKLVDQHRQAEEAARRAFDAARDRVAALGPPAAERAEVAADWKALATWAAAEGPARMAAAEAATARAAAFASERTALQSGLAERCRQAEVSVVDPGDVRSALADAWATASTARQRIDQALEDAATHRAEVAQHTRSADTARELGRLLSVRHFEKWILDETLAGLVAGATSLLSELSGGAFSLALDERSQFNVVDHRNADELRSARTLSGGETFLASLALALALADQIGSLAASGSARLESIFLDEGFGTLDRETLDTVAAAVEELGARGRMVGLISHVPELADRVPVRFEVTKGPAGATVTRVAT